MAKAKKRYYSEDEKSVGEIRERFLKVNDDRLDTVRNSLKPRQRIFLDILPLLFQYNDIKLPGYVGDQCANGIFSYIPARSAIDAAKSLSKTYQDRRMPLREYNIYALYLIGSAGTIAYTDRSDLDIWVCHRSDLDEESLQLLKDKCQLLTEWAESIDLEANFFVLTPESIRDGHIETMSDESSGSAQHQLLIEEFYRSGLLLGGRIPAWWLVPPEKEHDYYKHIDSLLKNRIITEHDIIDFGDVNTITAAEFYGAALWQLNKAIHSPYKSMLKLLLMEAYASEYPETELLCTRLKRAIYEGETDIDKLDSYVLMINKLDEYLSQQDNKDRLELSRKCFYFKVHEWLTNNQRQTKSRTNEIMTELTNKWEWSREELLVLDARETWKIDRVLEERTLLVNELTNSYRMLTELARQHTDETNISQEDLNILGRRLYSAFERKSGKIELINPGISVDLSEKKLVFVYTLSNDRPTWLLFRNIFEPGNQKKQQPPIKRSHNLIEMVAWCHFNGIIGNQTMITMNNLIGGYTSSELLELIDTFKEHFPGGELQKTSVEQLKQPARIVDSAIFINIGRDPFSAHTRKGLQLTSNRSDPLSFGGKWQNLVRTCSVIMITSRGEILTQRYDGEQSLLECITDQLAWSPISEDYVPVVPKTYCFASSYAGSIIRRINTLLEDLINFFYNDATTENPRYLLRVEKAQAVIQIENDVPRYEILSTNRELLHELGQPQEQFCNFYFDRYSNDHVILKLLQRYNKPGLIQLFYLDNKHNADIYVLDEYGSLYTQSIEYYDIPTMLGHYQHFFDAAIKHHNVRNTSKDEDTKIKSVFYPIKKTVNGGYYIELKDKPSLSIKQNYFDIQVIGDADDMQNESFFLICNGREFSNLEFGNNVLEEAVSYILSTRKKAERYPIYITDIDNNNSLPHNYQRIQTVRLLNQKKTMEEKLNKILKQI